MQSFQKMLPLEFALKEEKVLVKWEGREGPPPLLPEENWVPLGVGNDGRTGRWKLRGSLSGRKSWRKESVWREASVACLGKPFEQRISNPRYSPEEAFLQGVIPSGI